MRCGGYFLRSSKVQGLLFSIKCARVRSVTIWGPTKRRRQVEDLAGGEEEEPQRYLARLAGGFGRDLEADDAACLVDTRGRHVP